jgi:hypothetical protein
MYRYKALGRRARWVAVGERKDALCRVSCSYVPSKVERGALCDGRMFDCAVVLAWRLRTRGVSLSRICFLMKRLQTEVMCCCFTSSAATSCTVDHSNTGPVYSVDSRATVCLEPDAEAPPNRALSFPLPPRRMAFHLVLLLLGLYDLRILDEPSSREPCHKAQSASGHVPQSRTWTDSVVCTLSTATAGLFG